MGLLQLQHIIKICITSSWTSHNCSSLASTEYEDPVALDLPLRAENNESPQTVHPPRQHVQISREMCTFREKLTQHVPRFLARCRDTRKPVSLDFQDERTSEAGSATARAPPTLTRNGVSRFSFLNNTLHFQFSRSCCISAPVARSLRRSLMFFSPSIEVGVTSKPRLFFR